MNYEIHIKDRLNYEEPLILHYAARNTPQLSWIGGDDKTNPVVPSELKFTLENFEAEDGKYIEYFTSDETRYEVSKWISDTQELVWKGFLLPETYAEPYDSGVLYPEFAATDGLGLLKGKKIPEDFYKEEKSVTDIIAACLSLTKLDLEIYLCPAIEHHLHKNWKDIYADTLKFDVTKDSAFKILEDIVFSLRCQLRQAEGRWEIIGFNKLHLVTIRCKRYSVTGKYLGDFDITRNVKKLTWLQLDLSMVPAIKEVNVIHEAPQIGFDEEVVVEEKIDWLVPTGTNGDFIARHWQYGPQYIPYISPPNNHLRLYSSRSATLIEENKIELRQKPYIKKGTKLRFRLVAKIEGSKKQYELTDEERTDTLVYRISIGETQYFHNILTGPNNVARLFFESNLTGELELQFLAGESGFLNLELWEPRGNLSGIVDPLSIDISELTLEKVGQEDDVINSVEVDPESSRVVDITLPFSQDISGRSRSFYPEFYRKLDTSATSTNIEVPIYYNRTQQGVNYSFVSIKAAVLIHQFPGQVYYNNLFTKVNDPVVHFNFNGSEEMAIETETAYSGGSFFIKVYPFLQPTIDRLEWEQWTDSSIEVERKPYAQVVAEIESRLFEVPHLRLNAVTDNPVKISDIVEFSYRGEKKYFFPMNIEWYPDDNESSVTLIEGIYNGQNLGNLPPYVDAGPDIFLEAGEEQAQIMEAVVNDPDGEIRSLVWTKLNGDPGESFSNTNALLPLISGLTGDAYTFQLTATDSSGASASDTMRVLRAENYALDRIELYSLFGYENQFLRHDKIYQLITDPEIPAGEQLVLNFEAWVSLTTNVEWHHGATFKITKNGVEIFKLHLDTLSTPGTYDSSNGSLSYTIEDDIQLEYNIYFNNPGQPPPTGLRGEAGFRWLPSSFQINPQRKLTGAGSSWTVSRFT